MISAPVHSPATEAELSLQLDNEPWCAAYAFRLRWPQGFVCPTCGAAAQNCARPEKPLCRACGRSSSITAGTLLHGSKKSLATWLRALWWLSGERTSISITKLKKHLGFSSYQTGWAWMRKLRQIIEIVNRRKCRGVVLVDALAADDLGVLNQLLVAVESIARGRSTGRVRMELCSSVDQELIVRFCRRTVTAGSIIIVPGRPPFTDIDLQETMYTVDHATFHHEDALKIGACYRLWRRQNKSRLPAPRCTQQLADEFYFFHNVLLYMDRVHLFETLVSAALSPRQGDFTHAEEKRVSQGGVS